MFESITSMTSRILLRTRRQKSPYLVSLYNPSCLSGKLEIEYVAKLLLSTIRVEGWEHFWPNIKERQGYYKAHGNYLAFRDISG